MLSRSFKKIDKTFHQLQAERRGAVEPEPVPPTIEAVPAAEPEPVAEVAPEPPPPAVEAVPAAEPEPVAEVAPEPPPVVEKVPEATIPAAEPAPVPEAVPERIEPAAPPAQPAVALLELTVAELASAYIQDVTAANARFINQILKITGDINQIEVNNVTESYYLVLSSTQTSGMREVKCTFDKAQAAGLNRLTQGQTVTVQGRYVGYMIHILLKDCILV